MTTQSARRGYLITVAIACVLYLAVHIWRAL